MAEALQVRRQGGQSLDSDRPPRGVRRKLESLGVRSQPLSSAPQVGGYCDPRHASGDNEMTTLKLIFSAAIVALAANAILPTLVSISDDCEPHPECVQMEAKQ